jgi:hypothetical protein
MLGMIILVLGVLNMAFINMTQNKRTINKIVFFFTLVFLISILSNIVVADKFYIFEKTNELIQVDGHKIILVDATTESECIFTIDGEGFVIAKDHEDGTNEVDIFVKEAIPIRTKGENSVYCSALIDVKIPRKVQEVETVDETDNSDDQTAVQDLDENVVESADTTDVTDTTDDAVEDSTEDTTKKEAKKGWFTRLINSITNWLDSLVN